MKFKILLAVGSFFALFLSVNCYAQNLQGSPLDTLKGLYDNAERAAVFEDFDRYGAVSNRRCSVVSPLLNLEPARIPVLFSYVKVDGQGPLFPPVNRTIITFASVAEVSNGVVPSEAVVQRLKKDAEAINVEMLPKDLYEEIGDAASANKKVIYKYFFRINGNYLVAKLIEFKSKEIVGYAYCWRN